MLDEKISKIYPSCNYNCAETILHAADEEYGLHLPDDCFKMIAGGGGGMGAKRTCGAVLASLAVLSRLKVNGKAHDTENFTKLCGGLTNALENRLGSIECTELMRRYRKEDGTKCLITVQLAAKVLTEYLAAVGTEQAKSLKPAKSSI